MRPTSGASGKRRAQSERQDDSDDEGREIHRQRVLQSTASTSTSRDARSLPPNGTHHVANTGDTSQSSSLKGERARKFQAIQSGFGNLGDPEAFVMLNCVKCIGAGKAAKDVQVADSFLGETLRMFFKADNTLDPGRAGASLFPASFGSTEGEDGDESLDTKVAEQAHGLRALMIAQNVSIVSGSRFSYTYFLSPLLLAPSSRP